MSDSTKCPKCSSPIDAAQADGLCPACLMKEALMPEHQSGTVETMDRPRVFDAPDPAELSAAIESIEVQELLGYGGMGAVYRGRQKNLDRPVALKIIAPRLSNDPGFLERFAREAKTLGRLNHPNIVTVYDFGQAGPYCYLVMELIEGVNLRDAILSGGVTPEQALQIVPKVCDALQYAHSEGVVHRDIKPENILVGFKSEVKIADFGLAKMLDKSQTSFTLTGTQQVLGTRNYMAPEQIERPSTVDHRADIYSLGVVFYELLTGELPLGRFSLPSEKSNVNGQIDDVVLRTLEKEPSRRFQQASEVKAAVEALDPSSFSQLAESTKESPIPNVEAGVPPRAKAVAANDVVAGVAKQPGDARREIPSRDSNKTISLPFSNDQIHGGLSTLHGLAHLRDTYLEIEFRVHRLGVAKTALKTVKIPLEKLAVCQMNLGVFSHSMELQSTSLDVFDELPGTYQGRLKLDFEKTLKPQAIEFHSAIQNVILSDAAAASPGSTKHGADGDRLAANHLTTPLEQVSFKVGNIHAGVAEAVGIAKVTTESLIIEFDVIDVFGVKKHVHERVGKKINRFFGSGEKVEPAIVHIPYDNIVAVRFCKGVLSNKIQIQTNSLDVVSAIPESKHGKFEFRVPKKEGEAAKAWVRRALQLANLPQQSNLIEAKPETEEEQFDLLSKKLAAPRWGLIAGVAINGLWLSLVIGALVFCYSKWDQIGRHLDAVEREQVVYTETPDGMTIRRINWTNDAVRKLKADQPMWMEPTTAFVYESGLRVSPNRHAPQSIQLAVMFLVGVLGPFLAIMIGLFMLLGMIRIRQYWLLITGCVLFAMPLHLGALVTAPIGIWLLCVLLQPKTRYAFQAVQS